MTIDQHYISLKERLNHHPKQLEDPKDWLFVLGNTMRAMIENTDKNQIVELDLILQQTKSQDLKLAFDFCQGRFGGANFSYRKNPNYLYLCSILATFPEFDLSQEDQDYLKEIVAYNHYLLYEID